MSRIGLRPYLWMLGGALAFAGMAVLAAELRDDCTWQWIAIARSGLAMVFAAALVISGGVQFVFLRPSTLWMRSLAGSLSLLCGFFAMTHYDVSVVLTLTNMYPLWVALLSWPLLGTLPRADVWIAAAMGVVGVAILSSATLPVDRTADPPDLYSYQASAAAGPISAGIAPVSNPYARPAIVASLVSAFSSAIALIGLHRLRGIDHRAIVTHFSSVSLAVCLLALLALPRETPSAPLSRGALLMLLGVGVCATAGQLLLTKAFAAGEPSRVSVVGLTQTVFAMCLERLLHGQRYSTWTLVGMTLILAPTAWVLLRGRSSAALPVAAS